MANDVWTIKAALDWTVGYLERKGDENPRLSAQWLISEACGLSRIELYLRYDQPLSPEEREVLHGYVARRGQGEPLQYITGEVGFRHITLKVRPGVLIPRPETEVLVSEALALLPAAPRPRAKEDVELEADLASSDPASPEPASSNSASTDPASLGLASQDSASSGLASTNVASGGEVVSRETTAEQGTASQNMDTPRSTENVSRETSDAQNAAFQNVDTYSSMGSVSRETGSTHTESATATPTGMNAVSADTSGAAPAGACASAAVYTPAGAGTPAAEETLLVADIGTGTGCVACSIAYEHPLTRVVATDIEPEAVALAAANAAALNLTNRIDVVECDLGEGIDEDLLGQFDLLVSNPPYVPTAVLDEIPREVADFEPTLALDGGQDGLDVFDRLLTWCDTALKPGGALAFELHETCLDEAARRAEAAGFAGVRIVRDLADRPRVLTACKLQ